MDFDLRLKILEERVNNIFDKSALDTYFKEQRRILNAEFGKMIAALKTEFSKYNPKTQLNVKRLLLSSLPEKDVHISSYLAEVKNLVDKYNLDCNLAEHEIFLTKLGFIRKNMVNKNYVLPERYSAYLDVL